MRLKNISNKMKDEKEHREEEIKSTKTKIHFTWFDIANLHNWTKCDHPSSENTR